jgi:photosystem II stability/assembly factor-like uncharacterized protein
VTVCVSPNGRNVFETASADKEILVGTANGAIWLSREAGGWRETRRALEGKHIASLAIEPSRGVIFAGTHGDGLYASEDGGATWERRDNGIASPDIYGLNYVQAGNEVRIYAGTEPAHLYVSTDTGKSWTELPTLRDVPSVKNSTFPGPPHEAHVKNIMFDPQSADTIYAGVEVGGAFKSTDAGKTWTELTGYYEDVHRLQLTPAKPQDVYMATGRGIYHSPDKGSSWEQFTGPDARIAYPDALVIAPETPDLMFTAGAIGSPGAWRTTKDADSRIARSRDGGHSWQYLENGLPAHIRGNIEAMSINIYPGGFALVAGTTDGDVFFSEDEGEHWTTIAQSLPPVSKGGHFRNLRTDLVATH